MTSPSKRGKKYNGIIENLLAINRSHGHHVNSFYLYELPFSLSKKAKIDFIEYADQLTDAGILIRFPEKNSTSKKYNVEYGLGPNSPDHWRWGFVPENMKKTVQLSLEVLA